MIDPKELARLKALCDAATGGTWVFEPRPNGDENDPRFSPSVRCVFAPPLPYGFVKGWEIARISGGEEHNANGEFIAAARTALPALVAEVERQAQVIAAWREYDAASALRGDSHTYFIDLKCRNAAQDALRALGEEC